MKRLSVGLLSIGILMVGCGGNGGVAVVEDPEPSPSAVALGVSEEGGVEDPEPSPSAVALGVSEEGGVEDPEPSPSAETPSTAALLQMLVEYPKTAKSFRAYFEVRATTALHNLTEERLQIEDAFTRIGMLQATNGDSTLIVFEPFVSFDRQPPSYSEPIGFDSSGSVEGSLEGLVYIDRFVGGSLYVSLPQNEIEMQESVGSSWAKLDSVDLSEVRIDGVNNVNLGVLFGHFNAAAPQNLSYHLQDLTDDVSHSIRFRSTLEEVLATVSEAEQDAFYSSLEQALLSAGIDSCCSRETYDTLEIWASANLGRNNEVLSVHIDYKNWNGILFPEDFEIEVSNESILDLIDNFVVTYTALFGEHGHLKSIEPPPEEQVTPYLGSFSSLVLGLR